MRQSEDTRLFIAQVRRFRIAIAGRHRHSLGERPGTHEPHDPEVHTQALLASPAEFAASAAQAGVDDHLFPDFGTLYRFARGRHDPDGVGPEHVGHLQLRAGPAVANPDIQVVQAGAEHSEHNLAASRRRFLHIHHVQNVQTAKCRNRRRLHAWHPQRYIRIVRQRSRARLLRPVTGPLRRSRTAHPPIAGRACRHRRPDAPTPFPWRRGVPAA